MWFCVVNVLTTSFPRENNGLVCSICRFCYVSTQTVANFKPPTWCLWTQWGGGIRRPAPAHHWSSREMPPPECGKCQGLNKVPFLTAFHCRDSVWPEKEFLGLFNMFIQLCIRMYWAPIMYKTLSLEQSISTGRTGRRSALSLLLSETPGWLGDPPIGCHLSHVAF